MERRLPVVENEGYDVVLSEHIAGLLGWEREDILKKIDALIREYDLDSQFDSRGTHVVYFFEDTVADYEENIPLEDHVFRRVFWVTALGCEQIAKGPAGDVAEAFTDCYTKSFAEYAASLSTQDTLAEGFSAFLGKTAFSEPAYWTDANGPRCASSVKCTTAGTGGNTASRSCWTKSKTRLCPGRRSLGPICTAGRSDFSGAALARRAWNIFRSCISRRMTLCLTRSSPLCNMPWTEIQFIRFSRKMHKEKGGRFSLPFQLVSRDSAAPSSLCVYLRLRRMRISSVVSPAAETTARAT